MPRKPTLAQIDEAVTRLTQADEDHALVLEAIAAGCHLGNRLDSEIDALRDEGRSQSRRTQLTQVPLTP